MAGVIDGLLAEIATVGVSMPVGRLSEVAGGTVLVQGLGAAARRVVQRVALLVVRLDARLAMQGRSRAAPCWCAFVRPCPCIPARSRCQRWSLAGPF